MKEVFVENAGYLIAVRSRKLPPKKTGQKEISLNEAVYFFAPRRLQLWAQKVALKESPAIKKLDSSNLDVAAQQFFDTLTVFSAQMSERYKPYRAMVESLQIKLVEGKLQAYGMRLKPHIGTQNEQITRNLFANTYGIKWHKSSLENAGQRFEAIYVCRVATNAMSPLAIYSETKSTIPTSKSPGPKSAKPIIDRLYQEMSRNGDLQKCKTTKAIWRNMVSTLSKDTVNFPGGRGLAYSSFARHLKQIMQKQ